MLADMLCSDYKIFITIIQNKTFRKCFNVLNSRSEFKKLIEKLSSTNLLKHNEMSLGNDTSVVSLFFNGI